MKIKALPEIRLLTVIFAVSAMILTWLVVSRSLSAYLAEVAPQSAIWLSPRQPEALVNLADRSLNSPEIWNASPVGRADHAPAQQNTDSETTDGSTRNWRSIAATTEKHRRQHRRERERWIPGICPMPSRLSIKIEVLMYLPSARRPCPLCQKSP